jgi:hypothetical protein
MFFQIELLPYNFGIMDTGARISVDQICPICGDCQAALESDFVIFKLEAI